MAPRFRFRRFGIPRAGTPLGGASVLVAVGIVIGLAVGGVAGALLIRSIGASRFDKALRTRQQLLEDAEREAEAMRRQARDEEHERRLVELSRREQGLADREEASKQLHAELKDAKQREVSELER